MPACAYASARITTADEAPAPGARKPMPWHRPAPAQSYGQRNLDNGAGLLTPVSERPLALAGIMTQTHQPDVVPAMFAAAVNRLFMIQRQIAPAPAARVRAHLAQAGYHVRRYAITSVSAHGIALARPALAPFAAGERRISSMERPGISIVFSPLRWRARRAEFAPASVSGVNLRWRLVNPSRPAPGIVISPLLGRLLWPLRSPVCASANGANRLRARFVAPPAAAVPSAKNIAMTAMPYAGRQRRRNAKLHHRCHRITPFGIVCAGALQCAGAIFAGGIIPRAPPVC